MVGGPVIFEEGALLPTCPACGAPVILAAHESGRESAFDPVPHGSLGLWELAVRTDGSVIATYAGRSQSQKMHRNRDLRVLDGWFVPHVASCARSWVPTESPRLVSARISAPASF